MHIKKIKIFIVIEIKRQTNTNAQLPACFQAERKRGFQLLPPASPSASVDSEAHRSPPEKQLAARWAQRSADKNFLFFQAHLGQRRKKINVCYLGQ